MVLLLLFVAKKVEVWKKPIIGNRDRFHIACDELFEDIKDNDFLLIDDGKMRLNVLKATPDILYCEVNNSGTIKTKKGVNVPNVKLSMPFVSKKDHDDILFVAEKRR